MKKGALIGFGYWGQILGQTLKKVKPHLKVSVFDSCLKARKLAVKKGFATCSSLQEILNSKDISFVIIATPPSTHYKLVQKALKSHKHILVEKPFGLYSQNKKVLFDQAQKIKKVLMVDYTYLYSPGFTKLKTQLKDFKISHYQSLRFNSNFERTDINVIDDLIIHDLAMLLEIIPSKALYGLARPIQTVEETLIKTSKNLYDLKTGLLKIPYARASTRLLKSLDKPGHTNKNLICDCPGQTSFVAQKILNSNHPHANKNPIRSTHLKKVDFGKKALSSKLLDKLKVTQQAFVFIEGKNWQAHIYASRIWDKKIRTVIAKAPKKTLFFKEKQGQTYTSFLKAGEFKPLKIKSKTSVELMFKEFFKRINSQKTFCDFLKYKQIAFILKALNQSMELGGKKIKF